MGQGPSETDVRQHLLRFAGQHGAEPQHLLVACRGDFGVYGDDAPELVFADDEIRVVTAVAAVFQQQSAERRQGPAAALCGCRPGPVLLHFPFQIVVCHDSFPLVEAKIVQTGYKDKKKRLSHDSRFFP